MSSCRISSIIAATSAAPPRLRRPNTCPPKLQYRKPRFHFYRAARSEHVHNTGTLYDALMQTRLLAIFAALFAAIALFAGCSPSKSQDSNKELPDAATLVKESSETTNSPSRACT